MIHTGLISMHIAQMGPIGHMKAPGTMATICTMPLVLLLPTLVPNNYAHALFLIILALIARIIIKRACTHINNDQDPSSIVVDELMGTLITFWALPLTVPIIISGFILFRFFDITKIAGISYLEKYGNGWGILLDDVAAGIISNLLLHIFL
ncbi:MAG: phosphatidylglycerophosphatase A [Candidatus Dependentiae bacterium]|nr:phosphatidylglycerophosphatase A [Candidatus Dependentiae bacterium]